MDNEALTFMLLLSKVDYPYCYRYYHILAARRVMIIPNVCSLVNIAADYTITPQHEFVPVNRRLDWVNISQCVGDVNGWRSHWRDR